MNLVGRGSIQARANSDPGPSSSSRRVTNNNTYVLPGFSSLSSLLSESFSQQEAVEGLDDALVKDLALYEQKAVRYRYKMKKVADEKKRAECEGIEGTELKLEDPLKFWYSQVKLYSQNLFDQ